MNGNDNKFHDDRANADVYTFILRIHSCVKGQTGGETLNFDSRRKI